MRFMPLLSVRIFPPAFAIAITTGATARIGLLDGEIVCHVAVYDLGLRIGAAVIRAAGINLVETREDLRGQGFLMRQTMQAVERAIAAKRLRDCRLRDTPHSIACKFAHFFTFPLSFSTFRPLFIYYK